MVYCWMSSQIKTDGQRILLNNKNKNPIFPPYYYYYNLSYYILNFRAGLENDGWNSDFEKKKKKLIQFIMQNWFSYNYIHVWFQFQIFKEIFIYLKVI